MDLPLLNAPISPFAALLSVWRMVDLRHRRETNRFLSIVHLRAVDLWFNMLIRGHLIT